MMDQSKESRHDRGRQIASKNKVIKIHDGHYKVKSQTTHNKKYEVVYFDEKWICSCPDFMNRNVKCKHICAVEFVEFASKFRKKIVNPRQNLLHLGKEIFDVAYKTTIIIRGIFAFLTT